MPTPFTAKQGQYLAFIPRWTAENRPSIDTSKPAITGFATETECRLIDRSYVPCSPSLCHTSAVGMWESRDLGEISKSLWKPFCGFHGDVISIAVFAVVRGDRGRL